jgi:hypothetical protein
MDGSICVDVALIKSLKPISVFFLSNDCVIGIASERASSSHYHKV